MADEEGSESEIPPPFVIHIPPEDRTMILDLIRQASKLPMFQSDKIVPREGGLTKEEIEYHFYSPYIPKAY